MTQSQYFPSLILQVSKNQSLLAELNNFLTKQNIKLKNNPNLLIFNAEQESPKIKHVRSLISEASLKSFNLETRFLVLLHAEEASIPAQNALLKILEEPPTNTQIILVVNNFNKLLSTITSRCLIENFAISNNLIPAKKVIIPTGVEEIKTISEAIELAGEFKTHADAINKVEGWLEFYEAKNSQNPDFKTTKILQVLQTCNQYLQQNINVKLALENCFFKIIQISSK